MQKLYSKKECLYIQTLMNNGQLEIKRFDNYKDILGLTMHIALGDILVSFKQAPEESKIYPGYLAGKYIKEGVTKAYLSKWEELPIKSHLIKDFRNLVKDENGNIPYLELHYVDSKGISKKALVRELFEIEYMDADDPECVNYYVKYTDIEHNDKAYMVVKIVDEGSSYSGYNKTFLRNDMVDETGYGSSYCPTSEDLEDNKKTENSNALF